MADFYKKIGVLDTLDLAINPFITQLLSEEHEKLFLSCKLLKYNHYGMKQDRILMITDKNLYSLKAKGTGFITSRKIAIKAIEAITLSDPNIKSDEILIHVKEEYDYRYNCQ